MLSYSAIRRAFGVRILGGGDLLRYRMLDCALRAHDRDLPGQPGQLDVSAQVLGPHDHVRAAVSLYG